MAILCYSLILDTSGKPAIVLESALGDGQHLDPDTLRRLANSLCQIANDAERVKNLGIGMPYRSAFEY